MDQSNQALSKFATNGEPDLSPRWLDEWKPENGPATASIAEIEGFIIAASHWTKPASANQAAMLLDATLELYGKPDNWDEIAEFYLEVLADMPLDLIGKALRHVRATHRSHWKFPAPADLIEPVRAELAARRLAVKRAQACLTISRRPVMAKPDFQEISVGYTPRSQVVPDEALAGQPLWTSRELPGQQSHAAGGEPFPDEPQWPAEEMPEISGAGTGQRRPIGDTKIRQRFQPTRTKNNPLDSH